MTEKTHILTLQLA